MYKTRSPQTPGILINLIYLGCAATQSSSALIARRYTSTHDCVSRIQHRALCKIKKQQTSLNTYIGTQRSRSRRSKKQYGAALAGGASEIHTQRPHAHNIYLSGCGSIILYASAIHTYTYLRVCMRAAASNSAAAAARASAAHITF